MQPFAKLLWLLAVAAVFIHELHVFISSDVTDHPQLGLWAADNDGHLSVVYNAPHHFFGFTKYRGLPLPSYAILRCR